MELYLYVVDFDLRGKISINGVPKTINRQNHRNKLNVILRKMDAGNAELHNLNEAWNGLIKRLRAINESVGGNLEMRNLMETINEFKTEFDGFHMGGSCWLVISDQEDPDQFIKDIKKRARRYANEQVILPDDRLIVTRTKLSYMSMQPYKKDKVADWLISKGHDDLI